MKIFTNSQETNSILSSIPIKLEIKKKEINLSFPKTIFPFERNFKLEKNLNFYDRMTVTTKMQQDNE